MHNPTLGSSRVSRQHNNFQTDDAGPEKRRKLIIRKAVFYCFMTLNFLYFLSNNCDDDVGDVAAAYKQTRGESTNVDVHRSAMKTQVK